MNKAVIRKNRATQKVILRFYSVGNLGDDLFVHILSQRYENYFFIDHNAKKKIFHKYENLKSAKTRFESLIERALAKFGLPVPMVNWRNRLRGDIFLYVGGSIFMEGDEIENWYREKKRYLSMKMPYFILGANFGPYRSLEFKKIITEIVKSSADTCFRDMESYRNFSEISAARKSSDMVFTLNTEEYSFSEKEKTAVFSVIDTWPRVGENLATIYEREMANLVVNLCSQGYVVKLMSFCEYEGDELAIERILRLIPKDHQERVLAYCYRNNLEDALSEISKAEIVVGSRFHSVILGLLFNCKVLPISYSEKTNNFLDDLEFQGPIVNISEMDNFDGNSFEFDYLVLQDIEKCQAQAESQFQLLDTVLKRK